MDERFQQLLQAVRGLTRQEKEVLLDVLQSETGDPADAAGGQPGINDGNADSEPSSTTQ